MEENNVQPQAEMNPQAAAQSNAIQEEVATDTLNFCFDTTVSENQRIIKVVGVGGGGGNAVENMYKEGIQDVSFLIVNTDKAALENSKIPHKLLISKEGLGAGAQPQVAQQYAAESEESIRAALDDGTKMVFITAGMGGGTGTGASPVVAKISHDLGILTIGIVTIPFQFEGLKKIQMALEGVASIRQYVDALLVVNNNRLIDIYPDLNFFNAFKKADDTLLIAAKSISDIITKTGYINLDFADVKKTLTNSGVALISTGDAEGQNRVTEAIKNAVASPLLQDNKITNAKRLLFELCFSETNPVSMSEIGELTSFVDGLSKDIDVIWGAMVDNTLGDSCRIIVLASGFDISDIGASEVEPILLKKEREEKEAAAAKAAKEEEEARIAREKAEKERLAAEAAAAALAAEEARIAAEKAAEEERIAAEKKAEEEAAQAAAEAEAAKAAAEAEKPAPANPIDRIAQLEAELAALKATKETAAPVNSAPEPIQAAAEPEPEPTPAPKPEPAPIEGIPAKNIEDSFETIRKFYGNEYANEKMMDEIRKNYYVLDKKDMSNDELIQALERSNPYSRTAEQLQELKTISTRGNQNNNPDNNGRLF